MFVNQAAFEEGRRHQRITVYDIIPRQSAEQENYQVLAENIPSSFKEDLRIIQNKEKIDFWMEEKTKAWAKISKLLVNTPQLLFVLSGNPSAESESNGDNTFEFFDNFEDGSVSDWTNDSGGCIEAQTTQVKSGIYSGHGCGTTNAAKSYKALTAQTSDFILEYDLHPNTGGGDSHLYFIIADGVTAYAWDKSIWFDSYHHSTFKSHAGTVILSFSEQWYHWKYVIKPSASTYSLWIDDVSKQTDVAAKGDISGGLDTLAVAQYFDSGAGNYIDNIRVRKYASPEPLILKKREGGKAEVIKAIVSGIVA